MPIRDLQKTGFVLIDILLAMSISVLYIFILTNSSSISQDLLNHANFRLEHIHDYENSTSTTSFARLYGNDFLQTDYRIDSYYDDENDKTDNNTLSFTSITPKNYGNHIDAIDKPLCAVDFMNNSEATNIATHNHTPIFIKIPLPIPNNQPLTHLEVRDHIAYISTDASQASDPDLYLIDIHNIDSPQILSSINTGPGIVAFVIVGKHIFAAAASTASQLHNIVISGSASSSVSLSLESKYKLPLPYATATPPYATAIGYSNKYLYLGTEKWDGAEFSIIDIMDPTQPAIVDTLEIGNKVNDIQVHDNNVYVSAAGIGQLRLVKTYNPNNYSNSSSEFSPSGWSRQEGKTISIFENNLIFGRTSGGYDIPTDPEIFYWASTSVASWSLPFSQGNSKTINIPGGVYGIIQDRFNTYISTRQSGMEFIEFSNDISSSTQMFSLASSTNYYHIPIQPRSMTCDGHTIYILANDSPTIYAINFL